MQNRYINSSTLNSSYHFQTNNIDQAQAKELLTATTTDEPTISPTTLPSETPTPTPLPTTDFFSDSIQFSDIEYSIPLTIRHLTENQATFSFELNFPSDGLLVLRDKKTEIQTTVDFFSDTAQHTITIYDLNKSSEYEAKVILGNKNTGFTSPLFVGKNWDLINFMPFHIRIYNF